ncbi:DNA topoisomerase 3-alpha [Ophiocordyceps camponoti-floridani]|uniref:DNA topoisomerase 3-alpha n=1 Tax=Ophiocordyceps camponoti-floridani TaxID=2030778 RepID=A0A8H4Q0T0_9HYPO|nr:DNA topoisomerase 3-alpha [Ophiocordyceps camponoti-floridani]
MTSSPETPRPRHRISTTPNLKPRLHCFCTVPRKPRLRKVRRSTANQGRYFWSCPSSPPECDFFQWYDSDEDESLPLPLPRTTTMTTTTTSTSPFTQKTLTSFGVIVKPPRGIKRKHQDEFSDFASDEERQLVNLADTITTPPNPDPNPKTQNPSSPSLPHALQAPQVGILPSHRPPHPRKDPAFRIPPPSEADHDVTEKVMALLRDRDLPRELLQSVNGLLVKSARVVRGIERGRLSARAALRDQEDLVGDLRARVGELEGSQKALLGQLAAIKAQLMNIYQDN